VERSTRPPDSPRYALILLLILAAGLAIRFTYLDWRLDSQRFWDEQYSFGTVVELRLEHDTERIRLTRWRWHRGELWHD